MSTTTKPSNKAEPVVLPVDLRDYFAAKAMHGLVSSIESENNYRQLRVRALVEGLGVREWIARDAYKQADAMLAARGAQ